MKLRAKNNTILLEPIYEPWKRLSTLASVGEDIETAQFGTVRTHGSQAYVNTMPGNHLAWGRVLDVGPGAAWMRAGWPKDKPTPRELIHEGDIIGFDQCQEVSLKFQGQDVFFIPTDAALCRFNQTDTAPVPLLHYVMTREEEDAGRRFTFSGAAQKFHLPRTQASGTIKVSDAPQSQVKFTVERVVAVGTGGMGHDEIRTEHSTHLEERLVATAPGGDASLRLKAMGISAFVQSKVIEKRQTPVWIQPELEAVGRLALFLFTMSVDLNVHGVRHRFTNWQRVRSLVDEDAGDVVRSLKHADWQHQMGRRRRAGTVV
jgi:hypothetical protein